MQKTLRIRNDIHELSTMNRFLEEAGEELGLGSAFMMSLNLVMEEAVSNIIFYAYKEDVEDAVDISLVREEGVLTITLVDRGIAFDPTLKEDPDITLPAEEQPIGGLGIRECEEKILPEWKDPGVKICIDCSDLVYVSSAGLRLFLVLHKATTASKGALRLVGMRNEVRETFSLTGFNALFKIED